MGRTDEGVFEKPVEVALKHKLDIALYTLIDFDFTGIAVASYCFLADIKPGNDVFKKDNRLSAKV